MAPHESPPTPAPDTASSSEEGASSAPWRARLRRDPTLRSPRATEGVADRQDPLSGPSRLVAVPLLALVYVAVAKLGLSLASVHPSATAVWPPTGLAIGALIVLGYRVWPGVFLGAFVANLTTFGTVATSLSIATGNTLEGLAGAFLVARFAGGARVFETGPGVFRFVLLAALAATMVSATVGVTALATAGLAPWSAFGAIWLTWWLGDAVGALIVAPVVVLWAARPRLGWGAGRAFEASLLLIVLAGASLFVFGRVLPDALRDAPLAYTLILPLLWAAYRFGTREAAAASLAVATIAVLGTAAGSGPFVRDDPNEALLFLQAYVGVLGGTALVVAAVVGEKSRAAAAVVEARDGLERQVTDRTASLAETVVVLEHREAQLARAENITHIGSWDWDLRSGRVDWSDEMYRIYGYPVGAFPVTFEKAMERVLPEDAARIERDVERILRESRPGEAAIEPADYAIRHPDGSMRFLHGEGRLIADAAGRPLRMVGIVRDLTERKRSEDRFRALLESAPDAMVIVDARGRITLVNEQTERLFGWRREDLVGKPVETLLPHRLRDAHVGHRMGFADAPRTRPMGAGLDLYAVRKDGTEFPVEVSLSPMDAEEGLLVTAAIRDVTERRRAEAETRTALSLHAATLESTADGILVVDRERRMTSFNRTFAEMWRVPREILESGDDDRALAFVLDQLKDPDGFLQKVRALYAAPEDLSFDVLEFKDGRVFERYSQPQRVGGAVVGRVWSFRDVTERKRAEAELARQADVLRRSNEDLERFAYVASHDLQEPLRMVASYVQLLERRYKGKLDADADDFIRYAADGAVRMQRLIMDLLEYSRVRSRGEDLRPTDSEAVFAQVLTDMRLSIATSGARVTHDALPAVLADPGQLGQVFQNLLSNAIKFRRAEAPEIHVSAERKGREILFRVKDNGIGMAPQDLPKLFVLFHRLHGPDKYPGTGLGLAICKRIVDRHGGRIWAESEQGSGSSFFFTMGAAPSGP